MKIPREQDIPVRFPAKGAVFAERFLVIGKLDIPAQFVPEQFSGAFLHEDIFRIVVAHEIFLCLVVVSPHARHSDSSLIANVIVDNFLNLNTIDESVLYIDPP